MSIGGLFHTEADVIAASATGEKWIDVRRHLAVVFFSECFICEKSFHLSVLNQLNIDEFPVSSDWNTQLLPPYGSILCLILSKILSHHPRSRVIVPDSLSQKSV